MTVELSREEAVEYAIERMERESAPLPNSIHTNVIEGQVSNMVFEGAPADGRLPERTITDSVQNELRVQGVQEALVWIGELRTIKGEPPLSAPIKAGLMGRQARGIFDGVTNRVAHRPPAGIAKPQ